MAKRDDTDSIVQDLFDQIKLIIERVSPSLLQLAMDNGQVLAYWKDLPYRGESEKDPPKVKTRVRSPQEIRRNNMALALMFLMILACMILSIHFSSPDKRQSILLLFGLGGITLLLMAGFAKGIDIWNKYLRADDLDEPKDEDEKQEE